MWERFELFWTALEKFALFFSFIASLVILVIMTMIYSRVMAMEPPIEAQSVVEPVAETTCNALEKIQNAVLQVEVPISHTVPITLDIRFNPSSTQIKLADKANLTTGAVTIDLRERAGTLVGERATISVNKGNTFEVEMDLKKQVTFQVPVQLKVPVKIPLSAVDLGPEISSLKNVTATQGTSTALEPAAQDARR